MQNTEIAYESHICMYTYMHKLYDKQLKIYLYIYVKKIHKSKLQQ